MTAYWDDLPAEQQEAMRRITVRYRGMVPGIGDDGPVPDYPTALELLRMQRLENEVLDAHGDWLETTQTRFAVLGIDWTTANLARFDWLGEDQ